MGNCKLVTFVGQSSYFDAMEGEHFEQQGRNSQNNYFGGCRLIYMSKFFP